MRLINLTLAEMGNALNRGWGDRDSRVTMLLQQERADIDFALDPNDVRDVIEVD